MRYASIRKSDISNGDGIRVSIFFQGCRHHCKGCWNGTTWDFNGGKELTKPIIDKFIELANNQHIKGISILGGEPFQQNPNELLSFLKLLKEKVNKPIYLWTGYTFNTIPQEYKECLDYLDLIVDGRFVEKLKDYRLVMRGSSNQIIRKKEHGEWTIIEK